MAMEEPVVVHFVVVALYIGITAIGQSFVIGTLFTQPFATLFILLVYEMKTGKELPQTAPAPGTTPPPPPPEQG